MIILQTERAFTNEQYLKDEDAEKTTIPFKIGTVLDDVPIWIEAQVPYSANPETILGSCERIAQVFNKVIKLLEPDLST